MLAVLIGTACADPSGPRRAGEPLAAAHAHDPVLIASLESGRTVLANLALRQVTWRSPFTLMFQWQWALSPDHRTAVEVGIGFDRRPWLVAFDTHTLRTRARIATSTGEFPLLNNGVKVRGHFGLATDASGTRVFVAPAVRGDTEGIAVLDLETKQVVAFGGPFQLRSAWNGSTLAYLGPSDAHPDGLLLAAGTRRLSALPRQDYLFLIEPTTLAAVDSIPLARSESFAAPLLFYVLLGSANTHRVYVVGRGSIHAVDLDLHREVAAMPSPLHGMVVTSPDASTLYISDGGPFPAFPGSGELLVYDSDLQPVARIGLPAYPDGMRPATNGLTVSSDGALVFVAAGTASRGPLYGTQPPQLFVIDAREQRYMFSIPLRDWGPGALFPL